MKNNFLILFSMIFSMFALSCSDDDKVVVPENIELTTSVKSLTLTFEAQSADIELLSNVDWTAIKQGNSSWLKISPENGSASDDAQKITFTATENTDTKKTRTATVTFVSKVGSAIDTVVVTQAPNVENPELYKDQLILEKLYEATKGYQWTLVWDLDAPLTEWYGVKTGVVDGVLRVTELVLDHGGLRGKLPEEMGELTGLKKLVIRASVLNQTLPLWITKLPNLTFLALPECSLTGNIPEQYYDMTNLTRMDLYSNSLTGGISDKIGNLTKLKTVSLKMNPLGGTIPSSIGNLKDCYEINVSRCQLTGSIPAEIGNCTSLAAMIFESNELTGSIPSTLSKCKELSVIFIGENNLSGTLPAELSECKMLFDFRFNNNNITGELPASYGTIDSLFILNGVGNKLTGSIPASYGNCPNLAHLRMTSNNLSGELPIFLGKLQTVSLDSNNLTGAIPKEIYTSDNIRVLHLTSNDFEMTIPVEMFRRVNMEELGLGGNKKLTGRFPVDGDVDGDMSDMKTLVYLNVSDCNFDGEIPGKVFNGYLQTCYLHNNNFTGNLPTSIAATQGLSRFTVYGNRLQGEVAEVIVANKKWTDWLPNVNILPQQEGFGLTVKQ